MPNQANGFRTPLILLLAALPFAADGCARKTVHAAAPVSAAPSPASAAAERPMNTAPDTTAQPPAETVNPSPPVLPAASAPPPAVSVPAKKPPAPRRQSGEQAASDNGSEPAEHPPAPQISPQLSPQDQATYQRRTDEAVSTAEKNLQQASGKQLNAAQQDLVDKIRSFLADSRDASKAGDLARAELLAQKASLLSVELINSL
jgi:hypothetical protein